MNTGVKAYMESNHFIWESDPEDPFDGQWSIETGKEQVTPLQNRPIYMIFTPEQAEFMYAASIASTRKTLDEIKDRLQLYPPLPVCTQSLLNGSCNHTDCAHSRGVNEVVEDICKATEGTMISALERKGDDK